MIESPARLGTGVACAVLELKAIQYVNPYSISDIPFFVLLPVLIVFSGFFSGSETALFGLSSQQRRLLGRSYGVVGRLTVRILNEPRMLLITLLLGNMVANVLYFVISSALLIKLNAAYHNPILAAVAAVMPLLTIIAFGEVLPKLVANTSPILWVRVTVPPLYALFKVIGPIRWVLNVAIITPLSRLVAPSERPTALTSDELEALLVLSERHGVIDQDEQVLLREVIHLSQVKVRDVMVPRVDLHAVDVNADPYKVFELIERTRLSRYPVYDGSLDQIVGILYARQFLPARSKDANVKISELVRQVRFVPEIQQVDHLLADFRRFGVHSAIVVDEYGGTAGLVTLKDVVAWMVGDLSATSVLPHEQRSQAVEAVDQGVWRVSGRLSTHEWSEVFGRNILLPPRVSTVGGLVTALLHRMPDVGDTARIGNIELTVEAITESSVESVLIGLAKTPNTNGNGNGNWKANGNGKRKANGNGNRKANGNGNGNRNGDNELASEIKGGDA